MYYYDNPKGMIPTWLINWGAKVSEHLPYCYSHMTVTWPQTGVPQFLSTMRTAVFGYKDFLEEKRKEQGLETLDNEERLKEMYGLDPNMKLSVQ